jgi:hypothetical protein
LTPGGLSPWQLKGLLTPKQLANKMAEVEDRSTIA